VFSDDNIWVVFALGSAFAWGLHYTLLSKSLEIFSPMLLMAVSGIAITILSLLLHKPLISEITHLRFAEATQLMILAGLILSQFAALLLIRMSISEQNATSAVVIEMIYPLFVIAFSYLFFKELHLSPKGYCGVLLVMFGIIIISLDNKALAVNASDKNSKIEIENENV